MMKNTRHILFLLMAGVLAAFIVIVTRPINATNSPHEDTVYEKVVQLIKKHETLHQPRHWPLVGYGHLVLPGEKFSRRAALSEKEADALLRKDLAKLCRYFSDFGEDSLLLATLAYNIGPALVMKSTVLKKIKEGDRDFKENYLAHCRYKGKAIKSIRRRRQEEWEILIESRTVETPAPAVSRAGRIITPATLTSPATLLAQHYSDNVLNINHL